MCAIFGRTGILRDVVITCPFVEAFDTEWSRLEDIDPIESVRQGKVINSGPNSDVRGGPLHLCTCK